MKTRKPFEGGEPNPVSIEPIPQEDGGAIVVLPENHSNARNLDLGVYLGHGLDEWVWACVAQLRAFLTAKTVSASTVAAYWHNGLCYFFDFLISADLPCQPESLERSHLEAYIAWLKGHDDWAYTTQKTCYTITKPVLLGLQQRGLIKGDKALFPANPFPGSNSRTKGATPFSTDERIRLAEALRDDIIAIYKGSFDGTAAKAHVVLLLALAFRTGANTTSLLDMTRDCLKPHPFLPNMMLLELVKNRGNATPIKTLRYSREEDVPVAIPMDGVGLLKKVLAQTQTLADAASGNLKEAVWLYGSESRRSKGKLTRLNNNTLLNGIRALVARHNLKDDGGKPLNVTVSRLRKTMEMRLWHLSGGDIIATALAMGHTPQVADVHYLACTNEMREDAAFKGEALPDIYKAGSAASKVIPIVPIDKTPVGRCKDAINGEKAPHDGTPCDDFFACFSCSSYAVVGSPEDLHRLFSFYWFLEREKDHARTNDWRAQFHNTMRLIDAFTLDRFDHAIVLAAKERARIDPHLFWKSYTILLPAAEVTHG